MQNSKIEWTDHTFNPWIGCTKVSPGCQHCYAETFANRFGVEWGPQGERKRTSPAYWRKPITWNRQNWMQCLNCGWRGQANTRNSRFACDACRSHNVEPTRQRVFCASLADVFEDRPELVEWQIVLFELIEATPNLDWLVLTKRPENISRFLFGPEHGYILGGGDYLPNLWLGTSVENQEQANKRIPALLTAEGAMTKFLSCEPLLGPVDIDRFLWLKGSSTAGPWYDALGRHRGGGGVGGQMISNIPSGDIHWVICGGESGPHARPMHPAWAQSLRDQCVAASVPFFFKQWGESLPRGQMDAKGMESLMYAAGCEAFGGAAPKQSIQWDTKNWAYHRGKKAAGRLLDGSLWNQYPAR